MRNHRFALIAASATAAVTAAVVTPLVASSATTQLPPHSDVMYRTDKILPSYETNARLFNERRVEFEVALTQYNLGQQLIAYSNAVVTAEKAAEAAQHAREAVVHHSGVSSTSGASEAPGAIWACIIGHESGGNASVYNSAGSGASGLYQIMPGTWQDYDGYANAADAPAAVQTQRAEQIQASSGWGPWRGDGCTPVG